MARLACVHLTAFPLQILLQRDGFDREHPVAVVEHDRPQGRILQVNETARSAGILPGMTYAAGLGISADLRAGLVEEDAIDEAQSTILARLRDFSPYVEPAEDDAGAFWLDVAGLDGVYPSLRHWAHTVRKALAEMAFFASVALGWRRFATRAVASSAPGRIIGFASPKQELERAHSVPLARLGFERQRWPRVRDALMRLGVETLGDLVQLPERGLRERFGEPVAQLHRQAAGESKVPIQPFAPPEPALEERELMYASTSAQRLLFIIKGMLPNLLLALAERGHALASLDLTFHLDHAEPTEARVRPAEATLDEMQLVDLVRLKLEALELEAPVERIEVEATGLPATRSQLGLFARRPRRDMEAANRALARVRAELGEHAVVRAVLCDGHLPEASFEWKPLEQLKAPERSRTAAPARTHARPEVMPPPANTDGMASVAQTERADGDGQGDAEAKRDDVRGRGDSYHDSYHGSRPVLVRRMLESPVPLTAPTRHVRNDGWTLASPHMGNVVRAIGPYVVSGGWWVREVHRSYHYVETQNGALMWVYLDRQRRRWFLHAFVE